MAEEAITSRKSEYIIKNIEIFLNNKKDKLALKRAKESIIEFKKDYIIDGTYQQKKNKATNKRVFSNVILFTTKTLNSVFLFSYYLFSIFFLYITLFSITSKLIISICKFICES